MLATRKREPRNTAMICTFSTRVMVMDCHCTHKTTSSKLSLDYSTRAWSFDQKVLVILKFLMIHVWTVKDRRRQGRKKAAGDHTKHRTNLMKTTWKQKSAADKQTTEAALASDFVDRN